MSKHLFAHAVSCLKRLFSRSEEAEEGMRFGFNQTGDFCDPEVRVVAEDQISSVNGCGRYYGVEGTDEPSCC